MTSEQLSYLRMCMPFANGTNDSGKPSISEDDSSKAGIGIGDSEIGITYANGIPKKYAVHKESSIGGKLVPRSLFNILMNFLTKIHFGLQCGLMYQNRVCLGVDSGKETLFPLLRHLNGKTGTNDLLDPTDGVDKGDYPDNAILPNIDDEYNIVYYKHLKNKGLWRPFGESNVLPHNSRFTGGTNKPYTFTAKENCWIYIRAICTPSYSIKINGKTVSASKQNTVGTRYHGAVAHSDTFLLREGDVVTLPERTTNTEKDYIDIKYAVTPCVGWD